MLVSILMLFYIYIITKTYTLVVRKTYDPHLRVNYGITESQVNWVIQRCAICTLQAANCWNIISRCISKLGLDKKVKHSRYLPPDSVGDFLQQDDDDESK